jgi:hypothetical protein
MREVDRKLRSALRTINQQAAKLVAKGKYEEAQAAVEIARSALRFQDRFESVIVEWYESSGKSDDRKGQTKVPLWRYYVVVAQTLVSLGGEGSLQDVIDNVEAAANTNPASKLNLGASISAPDWKRTVERARRPMLQHGYIEAAGQRRWRITKLGRELADGREA